MNKTQVNQWRAITGRYGYSLDDIGHETWRITFGAGLIIELIAIGADFYLSGSSAVVDHLAQVYHSLMHKDGLLLSIGQIPQRIEEACRFMQATEHEKIQNRRKLVAEKLEKIQNGGNAEIEVLAKQRVGQDLLREELLREIGHCEISGITDPQLLWVSHIKDWAASNDLEKYDEENLLLLARNWDALFDKKFISFDSETGKMIKSRRIDEETLRKFGVPDDWRESVFIPVNTVRRRKYLRWHNELMAAEDANCAVKHNVED